MNVSSFRPLSPSDQKLLVMAGAAAGGFPTPAADYYEPAISLDELLNIRAPHVWIVQLEGESMSGAGLYDGSRLVVDRSIQACSGHIILAFVDGQPLVKRLSKCEDGWRLLSENSAYKPIAPAEYDSIEIFGVVTWVLTAHGL